MGFFDWLMEIQRSNGEGEKSAYSLACLALDECDKDTLAPVIAHEIERLWRQESQRNEQEWFPSFREKIRAPAVKSKSLLDTQGNGDAVNNFLQETFALGDKRRVSWGEATVDDHRQRMVMLCKLRDGINNTIRRHRTAIEVLEQAEVNCLNEYVKFERALASTRVEISG